MRKNRVFSAVTAIMLVVIPLCGWATVDTEKPESWWRMACSKTM